MVKIAKKHIATVIPDGNYEGVITNVLQRITPMEGGDKAKYIVVEIETDVDGKKITLNESAPDYLSVNPDGTPSSKLAHILKGLGYDLEKTEEVTADSMLADLGGKKVSFMTLNETLERGTFAKIVERSLKLL